MNIYNHLYINRNSFKLNRNKNRRLNPKGYIYLELN